MCMTYVEACLVLNECEEASEEQRPGCHCKYGHIDCSYKPNGPCQDEAWHVVYAYENNRDGEVAEAVAEKYLP